MEENKDITPEELLSGQEPEDTAADAQTAMPPEEEQSAAFESEAATEASADGDTAFETAQDETAEAEPAVAEAVWDFGTDVSAPRARAKGKGAFFGIFSAVLGVCLALTIAVMFLGENGFFQHNIYSFL